MFQILKQSKMENPLKIKFIMKPEDVAMVDIVLYSILFLFILGLLVIFFWLFVILQNQAERKRQKKLDRENGIKRQFPRFRTNRNDQKIFETDIRDLAIVEV